MVLYGFSFLCHATYLEHRLYLSFYSTGLFSSPSEGLPPWQEMFFQL